MYDMRKNFDVKKKIRKIEKFLLIKTNIRPAIQGFDTYGLILLV